MAETSQLLSEFLKDSIELKRRCLDDVALMQAFGKASEVLLECFRKGGTLLLAGNGGSAADAQHIATEFVVRMGADRKPLSAWALTTDSSLLTAVGNDMGFDAVFARQLEVQARTGDVFLAITTSGRSPNILQALEVCRRRGITTVLLAGRDGGSARHLADVSLIVNHSDTSRIQEVHILIGHALCAVVEQELGLVTRQ